MKQGNNMKKILMFIGSVTILSPSFLIAENMMPPAGPYRSIEGDVSTSNSAENNMHSAMDNQRQNRAREDLPEIPEWVKKRQADMNNWLKQQNNQAVMQRGGQYMPQPNPAQQHNQNAMQWNQRQPVPMNSPAQQRVPQAVNPQFSQPQINRMKQYFPASRGPVYGPNVPPPTNYNNPNYQNKPPVNQYPPMWR
jgi:hypothetical protein